MQIKLLWSLGQLEMTISTRILVEDGKIMAEAIHSMTKDGSILVEVGAGLAEIPREVSGTNNSLVDMILVAAEARISLPNLVTWYVTNVARRATFSGIVSRTIHMVEESEAFHQANKVVNNLVGSNIM